MRHTETVFWIIPLKNKQTPSDPKDIQVIRTTDSEVLGYKDLPEQQLSTMSRRYLAESENGNGKTEKSTVNFSVNRKSSDTDRKVTDWSAQSAINKKGSNNHLSPLKY